MKGILDNRLRRIMVLLALLLGATSGVWAQSQYVIFSNGHFLGTDGTVVTAPATFDKASCVWTTTATPDNSGTLAMNVGGTDYYLVNTSGTLSVTNNSANATTFSLDATGRQFSAGGGYLQYNTDHWDCSGSAADNGYELQGYYYIQYYHSPDFYLSTSTNNHSASGGPFLKTFYTKDEWAKLKYDATNFLLIHVPTGKFAITNATGSTSQAVHLEVPNALTDASGARCRYYTTWRGTNLKAFDIHPTDLQSFNSYTGNGIGNDIGIWDGGDDNTHAGSTWRFIDLGYPMPVISIDADGNVTITAPTGYDVFYTTDGNTPTIKANPYSASFNVSAGTVVKAVAVNQTTHYTSQTAEARYIPRRLIVNGDQYLQIDFSGPSPAVATGTTWEVARTAWHHDGDGHLFVKRQENTYYLKSDGSGNLSITTTVGEATAFLVDADGQLCRTLTAGVGSDYLWNDGGTWKANGTAQLNNYLFEGPYNIQYSGGSYYMEASATSNYGGSSATPYVATTNHTDRPRWYILRHGDGMATLMHGATGKVAVSTGGATNSYYLDSRTAFGANEVKINILRVATSAAGASTEFVLIPYGEVRTLNGNTDGKNLGLEGKNGNGFSENKKWQLNKVVALKAPHLHIDVCGNVTITNNDDETEELVYSTTSADPALYYDESTPLNVTDGTTVKAQAKSLGISNSGTAQTTYRKSQLEAPDIEIEDNTVTITHLLSDIEANLKFYYTTDGTDPTTDVNGEPTGTTTLYGGPFSISGGTPVKVIAACACYLNSEVVNGAIHEITSLSEIVDMTARYKIVADITVPNDFTSISGFTGTLDGDFHKIKNLKKPLFASLTGAKVKNVMFEGAAVSTDGNAGVLAATATGGTRIYNCGVLSGTVTGTGYVGGILGELQGNTRVINCFSYANVNGGTWGAGIVGCNASTATTQDNIATSGMVMNCMFYGNVESGTGRAPIYGGNIISNDGSGALNNFNFYSYENLTTAPTVYNCALAAEERYLKRFEFFRYILNSNRELAAWYATGFTTNGSKMAKWVMDFTKEDDERKYPYPILKPQGIYPSIINYDAANAPTAAETPRNQGKKLGTLTVNISGVGTGAPADAAITTASKTLNITDKDTANYNFNYYKVQLPYYNEVGTKNCTGNKVVTGWKITGFTGGTAGSFTTGSAAAINAEGVVTSTPYNFADRSTYAKDLYGSGGSNRVFSQGAYFNVPEGVTAITIEPYWATAVYLGNPYYDETYTTKYGATPYGVVPMGVHYEEGESYDINGSSQVVHTTLATAIDALPVTVNTVYDAAIVLVGNYHIYAAGTSVFTGTKPFTVMSADLDSDNEPDYSFYYQHAQRQDCAPIRFDFLNFPGIGMGQKVTGGKRMPNQGIFEPRTWFEVTNTCLVRFTEFEYNQDNTALSLILLGGIYEQFTSANKGNPANTVYIHVGDNVWFKEFQNGTHADGTSQTKHCPISVTGGEYEKFYLSGTFRPDATSNVKNDSAECYVNGGRFGEMAGAGQEVINGSVIFKIDHADIDDFYGGGINALNPIKGDINVTINNSRVGTYCGGPKFGDMKPEKTVRTTANGTTFHTYFGAGYGGTAYNRVRSRNSTNAANYTWSDWITADYTGTYQETIETFNDAATITVNSIATSYETELFAYAGGNDDNNVGRFYVNFASLSLARTKNVFSTLTGCIIETDFYGGGNLGAVDSNIVSTLTNCTVLGSAYGAGFSATVPSVPVYPKEGFTGPTFDNQVCMYGDPHFPEPTLYTWSSKGSLDAEHCFVTEGDDHWIHTNVDLKSLGFVKGNCKLTLKGTTYVHGNVFGGGNQGAVGGSTEVRIED